MEIEIEPYPGLLGVPTGGAGLLIEQPDRTMLHFPDPIAAVVTTDDYTVRLVVRIDPERLRPAIYDLHISTRAGGEPISPDVLRALELTDALEKIAERVTTKWVASEDGKRWTPYHDEAGNRVVQVPPHDAALAFKTRSRRVPFSEVEAAANAYRQALAENRTDPTEAVARALFVSRSTASRRIKKAREAGLLGAALGTKAGER
jgi:hypothetical protein